MSPDGRTLAFVRKNAGGRGGLEVIGIDGKGLRELLSPDDDIGTNLDWSPDGTRIGGTRDSSQVVPIYSANVITVRPDGSDLRKVTNLDGGAVNAFFGSFSPDGKWMVYRLEDHNVLSLVKVHPDGTGQQKIAHCHTSAATSSGARAEAPHFPVIKELWLATIP